MTVAVILGGHWGDEGKGKIVDILAGKFDINARYSGGANAGHTVINSLGSFALHQVPSGVFHSNITAILTAGVVIDPDALIEEMRILEDRGVDMSRLYISERAQIVMPHHQMLDKAMERLRGDSMLGTTGKGIGPAYSDKAAREGLRIGDMLDPDMFIAKVRRSAELANGRLIHLYNSEPIDCESLVEHCQRWIAFFTPRIIDAEREIRAALKQGKSLLLEGAQGALLDIDAGSYPFVTSSSTGVAGACASSGIPAYCIDAVVAVMKAYMTRVGAGPFPTELMDETGDFIMRRGNEFGTTTGRQRRCGWFDAVASKYSAELNGVTALMITKLDVLDSLETVRVCTGYSVGGEQLDYFPSRADLLFKAEPMYENLPGWKQSTREARSWEDLPRNAQAYLRRIEELVEVPIAVLSVGPVRDETFVMSDPLAGHRGTVPSL